MLYMRYMIKAFSLLALCFGLCACSVEQPASKSAFTGDFAAHMRKIAPAYKVDVAASLELKITTQTGHESTAYLDNAYKEYLADPKQRESVYAKFIEAFIESSEALARESPIDSIMITPIIKDREWMTEISNSVRETVGKEKSPEFVWEALNDELVIVYAEDSPKNLTYLTPEKLKTTGLKSNNLRELAVQNLKRMLPQIEAKGGDGIYFLVAGGTYEASLLLFDDIWQQKKLLVDGDYVIAVPSRDLLMITGSNNRQGILKIREIAQKTLSEAPYRLTADLFVYQNNRFVRLKE